jgi:hypothetical protein
LERFRAEHGDKRIAMLPQEFIVRTRGKRSPAAARNWLKTNIDRHEGLRAMGYNARNDEIRDNVTRMHRALLAWRGTRRFEGQLLPGLYVRFRRKADMALTCRYVRF